MTDLDALLPVRFKLCDHAGDCHATAIDGYEYCGIHVRLHHRMPCRTQGCEQLCDLGKPHCSNHSGWGAHFPAWFASRWRGHE